MAMTLKDVRKYHADMAGIAAMDDKRLDTMHKHGAMVDAIDAHLAQHVAMVAKLRELRKRQSTPSWVGLELKAIILSTEPAESRTLSDFVNLSPDDKRRVCLEVAEMATEMQRNAKDAALLNLIRNNTKDGLRIIEWKANAPEGCQVLFPSPTLLGDSAYIDAAMQANGVVLE